MGMKEEKRSRKKKLRVKIEQKYILSVEERCLLGKKEDFFVS